jgi:hypothetical protein
MRYFAAERSLGKIFPGELRNDGVSFVRRLGKALQPAKEGDTGTRKSGLNEQGRNSGLRSGEL